jgi:hypothetical protein
MNLSLRRTCNYSGSKGNVKSGGSRVITMFMLKAQSLYLLSLCNKSEQADISDKEHEVLIKAALG